MNTLLIFFAFPIATIIIAAILQKLLNSPIAVAALVFAIFLIITFAFFDETFLIATLAYTILAFLTAFFVCRCLNEEENTHNLCDALTQVLENNTNNTAETIEELLTNNNENNTNNSTCGCNRNRTNRCNRY